MSRQREPEPSWLCEALGWIISCTTSFICLEHGSCSEATLPGAPCELVAEGSFQKGPYVQNLLSGRCPQISALSIQGPDSQVPS